jgi:serine/threonine protein kinase
LHWLVKQVCCGYIVKEDSLSSLKKAGQGGFGDVFFLDENYVVKRVIQMKKGMPNPFGGNVEITQTDME